jgi:Heterokaryon incompatibility protein (HET)
VRVELINIDNSGGENQQYAIGTASGVSEKLDLSTAVHQGELWLKSCRDNHPSCWQIEEARLPTRVLDLEKDESGLSIVLIETGQMVGRYMTLSHCWGTTHPLTTTTSNLHYRMQGILVSELPKTFKDLVDVARGLGVRYVWIDSLCIIQDDASDWASEAGKMASVYSGSYLNIAGASAAGCLGGLFPSEATMDIYRPLEARRIKTPKAERCQIYARKPVTQAHDAMMRFADLEPENLPSFVKDHRVNAPLVNHPFLPI